MKMLKCAIAAYLCLFYYGVGVATSASNVCNIEGVWRIDCYPETTPMVRDHCEARGCCYKPTSEANDNIPWCFFPSSYSTYKLSEFSKTSFGFSGTLLAKSNSPNQFGKLIPMLSLEIFFERNTRLRVRLRDAQNDRYEVPISTPTVHVATKGPTLYDLNITTDGFGINIVRKSTGTVVLNTAVAPLLYFDQLLQFSSALPSKYVYGLGERHSNALINTNWNRLVFWARDQLPRDHANLYGHHPFYICTEDDGNSHGVFLLNSNAMEVTLQPAPAITWRMLGGIIDFYVFLGPSPEMVVVQYTSVVGKPFLPPYWSLGFHLCRWGYNSSDKTWDVVRDMRAATMPQDVQWNDIDYMRSHLDFTYDHDFFDTLPQMVHDLHENDQHYVMIIDPGISSTQAAGSYPAYDDGISMGIFINETTGKHPIEGVVWPGKTVFPDFTHPLISSYWEKQLRRYHSKVQFDGVWIDMNEPSNFVEGSTTGCPRNNLENPPYTPQVTGNSLSAMTLCSSSKHFNHTHYDVHSLTGLFEMKATSEALISIRGKRPFVISRSTFPSAGMYGGHWNGDIVSSWSDLKQSITSVINFNMFGVPMVGADICGFGENTTEELCIRWMQLGSFYPFSRNHNYNLAVKQAPTDFRREVQDIMRKALLLRYSLLPYLYSLFFSAHVYGGTVAKGLFLEFPADKATLQIDQQFMWGSGLLISPVLEEKSTNVHAYFPKGVWYYFTSNFGEYIKTEGDWVNLYAPLNEIPLHIRGGCIIPSQYPAITTVETRSNPIILLVAPDEIGLAEGVLYWDDGESLHTYNNGLYLHVSFRLKQKVLSSTVYNSLPEASVALSKVIIFNVSPHIRSVRVNNVEVQFEIGAFNVLQVSCSLDLNKPFEIIWK